MTYVSLPHMHYSIFMYVIMSVMHEYNLFIFISHMHNAHACSEFEGKAREFLYEH